MTSLLVMMLAAACCGENRVDTTNHSAYTNTPEVETFTPEEDKARRHTRQLAEERKPVTTRQLNRWPEFTNGSVTVTNREAKTVNRSDPPEHAKPAVTKMPTELTPLFHTERAEIKPMHRRKHNDMNVFLKDKGCCPGNASTRHLTDREGGIEWKGGNQPPVWNGGNQPSVCSWLIDVGAGYGIVLQFVTVSLQRGDTFQQVYDVVDQLLLGNHSDPYVRECCDVAFVFQGNHSDHRMPVGHVMGDLPVPPMLLYSGQGLVQIYQKHSSGEGQGHQNDSNTCTGESSFMLSYETYPLDKMPPKKKSMDNEKYVRYNCSTPFIVPTAFRCDMVQQCLEGEDELNYNCTYHEPLCDRGWVFANWTTWSACVRLISFPFEVRWSDAYFSCELGVFPTIESRKLAAMLISKSGFEEAYVNLYRNELLNEVAPHTNLYRYVAGWGKNPQVFQWKQKLMSSIRCAVLRVSPNIQIKNIYCHKRAGRPFFCTKVYPSPVTSSDSSVSLTSPSRKPDKFPVKRCSDGTFVQPFHFCESDVEHATWSAGNLPLLHCDNGRRVHYTLHCDGFDDCGDGSDEQFCTEVNMPLVYFYHLRACRTTHETVGHDRSCNGMTDCHSGSDEKGCLQCPQWPMLILCPVLAACMLWSHMSYLGHECDDTDYEQFNGHPQNLSPVDDGNQSSLIRVDFDGYGMASVTAVPEGEGCPETHFQCRDNLCIPSFAVNNSVHDCPWPYSDDEGMQTLNCPGYYRCYRHTICIHPDYLCDGVYHCPLKDDERYCGIHCPENCTCEGLAFICRQTYVSDYFIRYMDLSGSDRLDLDKLNIQFGYLLFLNVSSCQLRDDIRITQISHLRVFDVSDNLLTDLSALGWRDMSKLSHLNLSKNPLQPHLDDQLTHLVQNAEMKSLSSLMLRKTGITIIGRNSFNALLKLRHLDISGNGIKSIPDNSFLALKLLKYLDIRENDINTISKDMLSGPKSLHAIFADDYNLCCAYFKLNPETSSDTVCEAPFDELSSCSDLVRSDFFRVCLWIFSLLAVLGNMGVLIYRLCLEVEGSSSGFRVLVASLCGSDFLMGVYLMMIGSADIEFRGQYVWKRQEWTYSPACTTAGFLALVSNEVSAISICMITLDRLLVLRFPLKRHLHLTRRSALVACSAAWLTGIVLAVVPLLPATGWEFYSQTGICLPLPITRLQFPGKQYAFGVFIVLNFVLFLMIGTGQILIYRAVRNTLMADKTQRRQQDMAIARRLFLIVFSDFCCWFPVGLMGLLADQGTPIPGEVTVLAAIFVQPINSAINPFLYTLNLLLERRRKGREETRLQRTLDRLKVDMNTWPVEKMEELRQHVDRICKRLTQKQRSRPVASPSSGASQDTDPTVK